MNRLYSLLIAVLMLATPAWAQSVTAKLYSKVQGDDILVAVEIKPDFGCWFYDDDNPGDYSKPTKVSFGGLDGAAWTDAVFPEPKKKTSATAVNWVFKKKTLIYGAALGAAKAGQDASAVTAQVDGQVCNEGTCLDIDESLDSRGAGTDRVWEGFPAALLVAKTVADPGAADSNGAPTESAGEAEETFAEQDWSPIFAAGEVANARYFARAVDDDNVEVVIQVAVPDGYHMYGGPTDADKGPGIAAPTTIEIEGEGLFFDDVVYPKPKAEIQPGFGDMPDTYVWAYEHSFLFGVRAEVEDEHELSEIEITLDGQACIDGSCTPIMGLAATYADGGSDEMFAAAFADWVRPPAPDMGADGNSTTAETQSTSGGEAAAAPTGDAAAASGDPTKKGFFAFVLAAIVAGFITLLMPCTYPMIPITISYFTKQAEGRKGGVLPLALTYGLGIVVMFVIIGVAFGDVIQTFSTNWIVNMIIGGVFVVFALALFGMIDLNPPRFMMNAASKASGVGGYIGVFLMGLTLVITSFTCTGPFVALILGQASDLGAVKVGIGMAAFGITMATPFVFLALVPEKVSAMPSAGGWMNTVKVFMGFVELAASLKFFSVADVAQGWGILPREVFLILWSGIAIVAAMYLFGRINLKGETPDGVIGPGRMVAGLLSVMAGAYCFLGVIGYQLTDTIMSAMAPKPTYTRGLIPAWTPGSGGGGPSHENVIIEAGGAIVVEDDYDLALQIAKEKELGVLINFTGEN